MSFSLPFPCSQPLRLHAHIVFWGLRTSVFLIAGLTSSFSQLRMFCQQGVCLFSMEWAWSLAFIWFLSPNKWHQTLSLSKEHLAGLVLSGHCCQSNTTHEPRVQVKPYWVSSLWMRRACLLWKQAEAMADFPTFIYNNSSSNSRVVGQWD